MPKSSCNVLQYLEGLLGGSECALQNLERQLGGAERAHQSLERLLGGSEHAHQGLESPFGGSERALQGLERKIKESERALQHLERKHPGYDQGRIHGAVPTRTISPLRRRTPAQRIACPSLIRKRENLRQRCGKNMRLPF